MKFTEVKEEIKPEKSNVQLAGTGEPSAFSDADDEKPADSKSEDTEPRLYVAPHMKKEYRDHFLRLKTLRFKRAMARHNLYFKGFPILTNPVDLKQQLVDYF